MPMIVYQRRRMRRRRRDVLEGPCRQPAKIGAKVVRIESIVFCPARLFMIQEEIH
jgi:hypothetical protein